MMMPELRQDRSALRWIRGELDQTLREARNSLEDFVEGQAGRLGACVDLLHHTHGVLDMVQVYGAAMLADEMEQLALALSQGVVKRVEPAAEALMLGLVQLPAYLEKVEHGGADIPLVLLPLMNDLRAARDAPLVTETSLFAPRLNAVIAAETVRPGSGNRELPHLIHLQRSHYHRGLLNWIRGQDVPASLGQIRTVLDALNSAAGTARFRRLLDAGEALAVVLLDDDEAPALAVKPLFGKLDRVFKQILDQGEEAAMLDFPVDLLKNLLYYIARSNSQDPAVVAVRQAADLANNFPQDQQDGQAVGALGGPDRELFQAVGEALAQDLRDVKDHLDLYMRSDRSQPERLTGLAQPIQRIGDTLGMVGRGELRSRLKHRCDELRAAEQSGEMVPDDRLMSMASDLLLVESSLASLSSGVGLAVDFDEPMEGTVSQSLSEGEMNRHFRSAVDEALVELAKTKDAILEYLDKPDQAELLAGVPQYLQSVAGVLQMLELPEAARLLGELKPYIAGLASGEEAVPDSEQRDALADVVISAECYMQSAVEPGDDRPRILAYAEAALQRLGLSGAADDVPLAVAGQVADEVPQASADVAVVDKVADQPPGDGTQQPPGAEEDTGTVEGIDSEILEIFGEEAEEELAVVERCYPKWRDDREDRESLQTMRRSFHTLKGSGRIVGASNIGEFSWSIENLLNRVIDGTVPEGQDLIQLMDEVVVVLPKLVAECQHLQDQGTDVSSLSERAFALAAGESGAPEAGESAKPEAVAKPPSSRQPPSSPPELSIVGGADMDKESAVADIPLVAAEELQLEELEPSALGEDPFEALTELSGQTDNATSVPDDEVTVADTDEALERSGLEREDEAAEVDLSFLSLDGIESDSVEPTGISFEPASEEAEPGPIVAGPGPADESILTDAQVNDSEFSELESITLGAADSTLNAVFSNEVQGHLGVLADFIRRCREKSDCCDFDEGVRRAMHTLRGSSRTAGVPAMAELAGVLEDFSNSMSGLHRQTDSNTLDMLDRSHRMLSSMVATVEDPRVEVPGWEGLRDEVRALVAEMGHEGAAAQKTTEGSASQDELDPELLEIFLEEAKELLEALEGELADWESALDDPHPVARLQRTLHTIKGGARLTGISTVGDLSHALESVLESITERRLEASERLQGLVRHASDALAQDVEQLIRGAMPGPHPTMVARLEAAAHGREWDDVAPTEAAIEPAEEVPQGPGPEQALEPAIDLDLSPGQAGAETAADAELGEDSELLTDSQLMTDSELLADSGFLPGGLATGIEKDQAPDVPDRDSTIVQFPVGEQLEESEGFVPRRPLPKEEPAPVAGNERVRVSSDALDQMVNNAGEVSIYRARLEQQNSTAAFNLGELQQTTDRLRSQLRDLELETEAQILSRHEREVDTKADFDPLELDRYSTMQQLSRALSETVEDLSNLGQSLSDLSRDTDTLLLQQARVTTDLQDSLLRTRMVKFSSRVPRLERVVRQTSHSLGKQANLDVIGGEGDMDRAILERMMSPLEHLLRNSVSHGIEGKDIRLANGKAAEGLITLHLAREGADVVLTLSDDGAGLDRERIRSKAVERGLVEPEAVIEDDDLYQLILQPGFSTAQELSQVSGRGVGMDIVLTEVKQLGGTLEIDSQPGLGTSFTIRLPFTLAITDALLVTLGEEIYAVPHSSMDGVVRIPLDELRAIYTGDQTSFNYGDREYSVRYLGSMLGNQTPHLSEAARWLPMLLVRSGEHRVAIQVDSLLGNRQIVVKSIGAQLSTVRWFTGGTILADGQIALILDVNSLVRMDSAQQSVPTLVESGPVSKGVSVMVVDDSITVRKVTSRLLERHNMQVLTAKDGVDAVTLLQEHRPDVMLLDIEMPRMDGYELARHMRSTPELSDIPIIMITSRTGDKHRTRALELGVKRYLGKPYQEADLLENIYTILADAGS
ncbi:MAG: Hpt domain-containing protein [Sedimenticolaceae bacterium]